MEFKTSDDFGRLLADLPSPRADFADAARSRQANLTKPAGSLGRLEDCALWLASWSDDGRPNADRVRMCVFAGNHGVTRQGISAFPPDVTAQMVANFEAGGAAINALSRFVGAQLQVSAIDLERPTGDISVDAAMGRDELIAALEVGARAVAPDCDLLVLGEMGIGNTTIAAALAGSVFGGGGVDWAGPGTGVDHDGVGRKAAVIDRALALHRHADTAFERLRCLGGREFAAIAGAIVAARHMRVPVVVDGFIVTSVLGVLWKDNPDILAHCVGGHVSGEPGHKRMLGHMGLNPLLDLGMRLGEGSGAAVAVAVLKAAVATHNEMATFAEAAVSNRD